MDSNSVFVFLTLLSPCVLGYLIVMEGQCSTGQEPCVAVNEPCFGGSDLKKRIDSLEAQVAKLQESIERHINRSVVTGSCPDGFVRHNDSCYFIEFDKAFSFPEAVRFCGQHNSSYLIRVESVAENQFITDILRRKKLDAQYWNALTDSSAEDNWIWYGTGGKPNFINWAPGQPSGGVNENCAAFGYHTDFSWHDYSCNKTLRPVCETRVHTEE